MTQEKRMKALEKIADVGGWGGGVRKSVGDIADIAIGGMADKELATQQNLYGQSDDKRNTGFAGLGAGTVGAGASSLVGLGGLKQIVRPTAPRTRIGGVGRLAGGAAGLGLSLLAAHYGRRKLQESQDLKTQGDAHGEEAKKWQNTSRWLMDVGRKLR